MSKNNRRAGIDRREFMKVRAVTVCSKVGIGRKAGHRKRIFVHISKQLSLSRKFLIVQGNYGKIIHIIWRKLCF